METAKLYADHMHFIPAVMPEGGLFLYVVSPATDSTTEE